MPQPRIKVVVECPTQTALDQCKAAVEAELPPPSRVRDRPHDWSTDGRGTLVRIGVLDVRFRDTLDADATWAKLRDKAATLTVYGTGVASYHICSHDDPLVLNCKDDPRSAYREVRF